MEDCIILEELSLVEYLRQSKERLLKSPWRSRNCSEVEHPNDYKSQKKARGNSEGLLTERAPWAIHTVYEKKEVAGNESLSWLAVGDRKKETEDLPYLFE